MIGFYVVKGSSLRESVMRAVITAERLGLHGK